MAVEGSFICYADHMQAINSLKNVDSTALLQFLHPILNMLLHLIGSGGETLQVLQFILSGGFPLIALSILFTRTWLHCLVPLFGRRIIDVFGYLLCTIVLFIVPSTFFQVAAFRAMVNILTRCASYQHSIGLFAHTL